MEVLVDDDCGFRPSGQVRVAETAEEMEGLGRRSRAVDALGLAHREAVIDRSELRRLLPEVAPHCLGGLHVADDGFADPFRTTTAFRRAAEGEGVRIIEGAAVTAVARPDRDSWRVTAGVSGTNRRCCSTAPAPGAAGWRRHSAMPCRWRRTDR